MSMTQGPMFTENHGDWNDGQHPDGPPYNDNNSAIWDDMRTGSIYSGGSVASESPSVGMGPRHQYLQDHAYR